MCTGVFRHLWLRDEVAQRFGSQPNTTALTTLHGQINEQAKGVIRTVLASMKEWQELDQETVTLLAKSTLQILQPALPDRMKQSITEILLATIYVPPAIPCSNSNNTKKAKVVVTSNQKYASASLNQQWRVLSACNPGQENDPLLVRRAQLRAIERLFYSTSKWFAPDAPLFNETVAYLDLQELCHLSAVSTDLNYALSLPNPRIWKAVSRTFGLRDIFWPEYSRAQACVNYDLLKCMKEVFNILKVNALHTMADVNKQVAIEVLQKFKIDQPLHQDIRVAFNTCILPVFDCIAKRRGNEQFANFLNQLLAITLNNTPWQHPITSTLMHAAVGNFGDKDTLKGLSQAAKASNKNRNLSPTLLKQTELALTFLAKYGTPTRDFNDLLTGDRWIPQKALPSILRLFIQKGVKATDSSLDLLLASSRAASTLLEILVKEAGAKTNRAHLDKLLYYHSVYSLTDGMDPSRRQEQAQDILRSIELLKSAPNTGEVFLATNMHDIFYGMALYENRPLMDALLSLGYKPDNSSIISNTIRNAMRNKPRNSWISRASPETIKLLLDCGAKPPENVCALIEQNYSDDDFTRARLLNLFGFSSNF